ncbi:MAG: DUF6282 family protein [Casimicrobiaceae bacterium]
MNGAEMGFAHTNGSRAREPDRVLPRPGAHLLVGAVDGHVHACPHLNGRSVDVFEAVEQAAAAGMRAIGLMDNFCSSVGYAALARRRLGHLGVEVFGGVILEPQVGGLSVDVVRAAIGLGYPDGEARHPADGARFVSLPTHHTRAVAMAERRDAAYIESCLTIPDHGPLPDVLAEILDLVATHDIVLNTGHLTAPETIRLVELAKARGVQRMLCPASYFEPDQVRALTALGAYAEFSFFFVTHATQVGLTHVDTEKHQVEPVTLPRICELIAAASPEQVVVSGDCGVAVLPPPVEGLREFLWALKLSGVSEAMLRRAVGDNPARLFGLAAPS